MRPSARRSVVTHIERRSRVGGWPIAVAVGVLALFLYAVHYALLPFVFAAATAFLLDPPIRYTQRRTRAPRWAIAFLVYLALLSALAAVCFFVGRAVVADVTDLVQRAPQIAQHVIGYFAGTDGVRLFGKTYTARQLTDDLFAAVGGLVGGRMLAGAAGSVVGTLAGFFLTLVLIPFFLVSGPGLARGAIRLVPPERRGSVQSTVEVVAPVLRRYLVGLFLIVVYATTIAGIGFGPVLMLPHAALLALAVGLLELLPAIGPMASAILMAMVALEQGSLAEGLGLMAFVLALRLSIDNLIGPILLGRAARLHPVVVIFSFVCGAMLFGIVGLLLAVPTAATIRIVLTRYYAEPIEPESR